MSETDDLSKATVSCLGLSKLYPRTNTETTFIQGLVHLLEIPSRQRLLEQSLEKNGHPTNPYFCAYQPRRNALASNRCFEHTLT